MYQFYIILLFQLNHQINHKSFPNQKINIIQITKIPLFYNYHSSQEKNFFIIFYSRKNMPSNLREFMNKNNITSSSRDSQEFRRPAVI